MKEILPILLLLFFFLFLIYKLFWESLSVFKQFAGDEKKSKEYFRNALKFKTRIPLIIALIFLALYFVIYKPDLLEMLMN